MKIIYNKVLPFGPFSLINFLGLVFSKMKPERITDEIKYHEHTHTEQQEEILIASALVSLLLCNIYASWWYLLGVIIMPFAVYAFCFLCALILPPYHNAKFKWDKDLSFAKNCKAFGQFFGQLWIDAYRDNCFEREANAHEKDPHYVLNRSWCAWGKYIVVKNDEE